MTRREHMVSGELVRVIGPKPDDWRGLGQNYPDAVLVEYPPTPALPDGEIGAVPRAWVDDAD